MSTKFFFVFAILLGSSAFAGQSGYLKNGELVTVYTDGKKVGEWPHETPAKDGKSAASESIQTMIYFEEDHMSRCYISKASTPGNASSVSCIRKK